MFYFVLCKLTISFMSLENLYIHMHTLLKLHSRISCLRFSISISIIDNSIECLVEELHGDHLWCGPNVQHCILHSIMIKQM